MERGCGTYRLSEWRPLERPSRAEAMSCDVSAPRRSPVRQAGAGAALPRPIGLWAYSIRLRVLASAALCPGCAFRCE